ncbi:WRC domain-containing protein [Heracleum sosnowskyi]|uniref:WRC domain-containing protein n=1 Tax=Heracleum sosnowskyi TaxID=360622 RepID=A0AAD8HWX3_9APIA|nr:WRC domain-containing protein [Heracleum sosnowskyi]
MRIRKNLKITHQVSSESSYSATTHLQAYICQLNQSPWDVSPSSPLFHFQLQEHDSFLGNGMCEDTNGPLKRKCVENIGGVVEEDEEEVKLEEDSVNYCSKTDENGNWICGLEAKEGETFCEFHLRSYIALAPQTVGKKIRTKAGKNNGSKKAKKEVDPNPYQSFNYYSGFGPNWGKKRGGARELSKRNEAVATPCSSNGTEDLSIFEDEDEDDDEKCQVNGTKRVRKRIKARSLKSLM